MRKFYFRIANFEDLRCECLASKWPLDLVSGAPKKGSRIGDALRKAKCAKSWVIKASNVRQATLLGYGEAFFDGWSIDDTVSTLEEIT